MASNMRRRRQAIEDAEDTLTESLLHDTEEDDGREHGSSEVLTPRRHALIVHPGEFNLQAFVATILDWWRHVLGQLANCAIAIWPAALVPPSEPKLSLIQAERLGELREKVAVRFDIGSTAHQDALRRLWELGFPELPCTALKTPQWKEMGWQGDDPSTDFRGAGFYGLENLIFLGEAYPETFRLLMDKTEGSRATWEYPFAVAGLNLTFMLSDVLELHAPQPGSKQPQPSASGVPRSAAARAFLPLLTESPAAFEELYCTAFQRLDTTWLSMRASYMEFNAVMKRLKADVEAALASRPADLRALRAKLAAAGPL